MGARSNLEMKLAALLLIASTVASAKSPLSLHASEPFNGPDGSALCSPCIQFSEQGLNILLNEILNVGVIGGCGKLCSGLKDKTAKTACDLVCDIVGIKAFIKALNNTDLDPIYFCERIDACPKANPKAKAQISQVSVSPASGASGTKFEMQLGFVVSNSTSVSEIHVSVDGPTTDPVSQGFIQKGFADGAFTVNVSLDTTSDPFPPGDPPPPPVLWNPGLYNFTFELCQGECGSKHPGSMLFGKKSGHFTITAGETAPPPEPATCKTDSDCPCSYCMNDSTKTAPYLCHPATPGVCCTSDADCPGSYCVNYKPKVPPFHCHGN